MKIQYVMPIYSQQLASDRIRIALIVQELQKRGHQIIFSQQLEPTADCFYFSKYGDIDQPFSDPTLAQQARSLGKPVIYDICDNYFEFYNPWKDPNFPALWQKAADRIRQMCSLASHIVCTTAYLERLIKQNYPQIPVTLIPDTYEYPEASAETLGYPKLAWYGHFTNILPLVEFQRDSRDHYQVRALVNQKQRIDKEIAEAGYQFQNLQTLEWQYDLVTQVVRECDLVIIPQRDNAKTRAKGHCRLTTALRLGRFSIASPLPAYQEFKDFSYLTTNLEEGIQWALKNPHLAEEKVRQGQAYLRAHYSPEKIADRWEQMYLSLLK